VRLQEQETELVERQGACEKEGQEAEASIRAEIQSAEEQNATSLTMGGRRGGGGGFGKLSLFFGCMVPLNDSVESFLYFLNIRFRCRRQG